MKQNLQYSYFLDISKIIKILLNSKIKNYKNFLDFLNLMQNANGQIEIKISRQQCYYQYPINIVKNQIQIFDNQLNPFQIFNISNYYTDYIKQKTKYCNTLDQAYKQLKYIALYQDFWGILNFNVEKFSDKNQLIIAIDHQLTHLIHFLIRISGLNHNYCMNWSKIPHNKFNSNQNKINYFLDEDEFKSLCSTYIQRIVNSFKNNSNNFLKENIQDYYKIILAISETIQYTPKNLKNIQIFQSIYSYIDIKTFINTIFNDSKTIFSGRNKFTIFKKWLHRSLIKILLKLS